MTGEQFSEQDFAFINDAIRDVNFPYGKRVYLKQYAGVVDVGDPMNGVQAKYGYKITPVQAIVESLSAQDIAYSGGIYMLGDLRVTLTQKLNFIDQAVQTGGLTQGDLLQHDGYDYRIVGRIIEETLVGSPSLYVYVLRKVGTV